MRTTQKRRRTSKISAVQSHLDVNACITKVKTPKKEPCRRPRKRPGSSGTCLVEKNNNSPSKAQAVPEQHPVTRTCHSEANCGLTLNEVPSDLQAPAKIKLQLFPIDASTRKALEKGGYNPHLELILSKQKKISSVLRHLKAKWGGVHNENEILLFPYNIPEGNVAGCLRWTSDDTNTRVIDVYEAIGCPAIFRLRYGWLANEEPGTFRAPTFSHFKDCLESESIKRNATSDDEKKLEKNLNDECYPISTNGLPDASEDTCVEADGADGPMANTKIAQALAPSSIGADSLTNVSIGALLSETSLQATVSPADPVAAKSDASSQQIPFSCGSFDATSDDEKKLDKNLNEECYPISTNGLPDASEDTCVEADGADGPMDNMKIAQPLAPSSIWADSLTSVSIGALLSETSLQATVSPADPVAARSDASSQQIPFNCDSFDAAIAAHIYRHSQGPQRAPIASHSSFLDADETCHAFSWQKFASSSKDVISLSKSEALSCTEKNIQPGVTESQISPEAKPDSQPNTQENIRDSSNLGLSGIKWADSSLGPFDLSLSRPLTGVDNISLSSFLATSLDAFQNFSLFGRDKNVTRS